jgi:hypothetical protein
MGLDLTKLYTQAVVYAGTAIVATINLIKTVGEIRQFGNGEGK